MVGGAAGDDVVVRAVGVEDTTSEVGNGADDVGVVVDGVDVDANAEGGVCFEVRGCCVVGVFFDAAAGIVGPAFDDARGGFGLVFLFVCGGPDFVEDDEGFVC